MPKKDKFKINMQEKVDDNVCDLSLSNLAVVPVREIASFKRVTTLDLSSNRLTILGTTFGTLTRLVKLDLSNNQISILPDNFGCLRNLRHLNLFNNRIEYLPLSFGDLGSLRYLDLKGNPLTAVLLDVVGPCLTARDCAESARCTVHFISYMRSEHERNNPSTESDTELTYDSDDGNEEQCQCGRQCSDAGDEAQPESQPEPEPVSEPLPPPISECNSRASSRTAIVDEEGFTLVVSRRNSQCTPTPPGTPFCPGDGRSSKNKKKKRSNNNNNNNNNKKGGKPPTFAPQTMAAIHQSMERSTRPPCGAGAANASNAVASAAVAATATATETRKNQQHQHNNNANHHNGHKQPNNNSHNNNQHNQNHHKSHKKSHHRRPGGHAGSPVLASISTFVFLLVVNVLIIYVMMFKNPEFAQRFVEFIPAAYRQWLMAKSEIFRLRVSDWISEFRTAPDDN